MFRDLSGPARWDARRVSPRRRFVIMNVRIRARFAPNTGAEVSPRAFPTLSGNGPCPFVPFVPDTLHFRTRMQRETRIPYDPESYAQGRHATCDEWSGSRRTRPSSRQDLLRIESTRALNRTALRLSS